MIQITRMCRSYAGGLVAGGLVAGAIGVAVLGCGTASADPVFPAPAPVPAPSLQGATTVPGGVNNRFVAAPAPQAPAPYPAAAAAPLPPTVTPSVTGTLREYLQSKGVRLEAQRAQGFKGLDITLPLPTRWTQVPDPNVPDAFAVIADRLGNSIYTSNAQLVVYKLVGDFDPRDAITHGFVDSQQLLVWQTTNASLADFGGFPSSVIEGTFRQDEMTLNTSRRNVIATSGPDRYLVSLAVTTAASQAVADAPATNAIINGFRVTAPGAPAPAPAPAPLTAAGQQLLPNQAAQGVLPPSMPTPPTAPIQQAAQTIPVLPAQQVQQPVPNLLTLVPGLPPLPNLNLGTAR